MSTAEERTGMAVTGEDETVALGYLEPRERYAWQRLLHARQSGLLEHWLRRSEARRVLALSPGLARLGVGLAGVASGIMVDSSRELVAVARKRLHDAGLSDNWRVVHGDAFGLGALLAGQHFEFAYTFRFLRHFGAPDRARVYAELRDRLVPGGVLALDVVNSEELQRVEAQGAGEFNDEIDFHDASYTEASFRAEMTTAGFEVLELVPVVGHFALQARLGRRLERSVPRLADLLVRAIEVAPVGQPLEWVALCRKPR